ncbi:hypothetical protein D9758_004775 [Tetrapyrgos nigripes]|uniref:Uncharacterized protein n=1 Tax=Tetrapyrgos nigripes TaxID=182062 RepID=A0A8H5G650_9AGAR|nr:hypothetical protein D9758_004775 [Tetrapyrgos nigripes]
MHTRKRSKYLELRQADPSQSSLPQSSDSIFPFTSSISESSVTTGSSSTSSLSSTSTSDTSKSESQSSSQSSSTATSSSFSSSSSSSSFPSSSSTSSSSKIPITTSSSSTSAPPTPSPEITTSSFTSTSANTRILVTEEPSSSINSTPVTTFPFASSITPGLGFTSSSAFHVPTAVGGASSDSGQSNTPALAGMIVGIIVGCLAVFTVLFIFIKRRRHSKKFEDVYYIEKPADSDSEAPSERSSRKFLNEPMAAYASSEPEGYLRDTITEPSTATPYAAGSLTELTYSYAQDVNNQYPYYPNEVQVLPSETGPTTLKQSPVSAPALTISTSNVPSETNLNPFADPPATQITSFAGSKTALNSAASSGKIYAATSHSQQPPSSPTYQPSIDSFYGGGPGRGSWF